MSPAVQSACMGHSYALLEHYASTRLSAIANCLSSNPSMNASPFDPHGRLRNSRHMFILSENTMNICLTNNVMV